MIHNYNTRAKKDSVVTSESQMVNNVKDKIVNLKEIVINHLQEDNEKL